MESYEKLNYAIRPNKRTQRKMVFEALARYQSAFPATDFRYVGFGSMWFSDFLYAHRRLGLTDLVSIERSTGYRRATFNRPFKCVKVVEGDSSAVLPSLKWIRPSIVWLDYDYAPEGESLQDLSFLGSKLVTSSVLIVTYEARPPWDDNASPGNRIEVLRSIFGDAFPVSLKAALNRTPKKSGLTHQSEYPSTLVTLVWSFLKGLLVQNGRSEQDGLSWHPLFSFYYRDGAPMVTIGAALLTPEDAAKVRTLKLSRQLTYLKGEGICRIALPPLTHKERIELDRRLPDRKIRLPFPLTKEHLDSYARYYSFYHLMAEVEL
jgi:hypothetical protein